MKMRLLPGLICCILLGGCASSENPAGVDAGTGEETKDVPLEIISEEETEMEEKAEIFGAVPYFDEDRDGMLQYADGYLYGYLEGRIFRMDAQTGETTVLAVMRNTVSNHFCIDNGYLYFFYIPQVSFIDGIRGDLFRLDLNGADSEPPVLLAEDVRIYEENATINGNITVDMSVYEDILYIMMDEEAACFRLLADGGVEEIALKETLYGLLPEGYSAPWRYNLPSIPYCAAHYGYFFAQNEDNFLARVDVKSGQWESVGEQKWYRGAFLSHESIYLLDREKGRWIRYNLEDVSESAFSPWLEYGDFYDDIVGFIEDGAYLLKRQDNSETGYVMQLMLVDWEGNENLLGSFEIQIPYPPPYGIGYHYVRDGWFYYRDQWEDGYWLVRIALTGGEPEKLYCYDIDSRLQSIAKTETVEKNTENTGEPRIATGITKLWIKEEQAGDAAINRALNKIYAEAEAELEEDNRQVMEEYFSEEETAGEWGWLYEDYGAYLNYADEDYVCICMMGEGYWGGAHGSYWYDYYVFDRHTGKRLTLQDFVNNSPEEIVEIVKAYIVAGCEWSSGGPAEDALEPDRFFLTAEGLGIHYDVYEIGSYAHGPFAFIIPFDAFDMKEGMQP